MRIIALALTCLMYISAPLRAQEMHYCDEYGRLWNEFSGTVLDEAGLSEKVRSIEQAIASVKTTDLSKRNIAVIITDCPVYGYYIRTMAKPSVAVFMQALGLKAYPQNYDLYITLATLRKMSDDDLVEVGREQACLVHAEKADDRFRRHEKQTQRVIECRLDTARTMGDREEAKWFARLMSPPKSVMLFAKHPEGKFSKKFLK